MSAQVDTLEDQVGYLEYQSEGYFSLWQDTAQQNERLQQENSQLKQALEFYRLQAKNLRSEDIGKHAETILQSIQEGEHAK